MRSCPPSPSLGSLGACVAAFFWFGISSLAAEETLFANNRTGNDSGAEGSHYELGTVFRASTAGTVTHLRVYALASESGAHTARLWRNSDSTVIGGPYFWTYGGATGWITLDIPDVPITADTDYTVVVSTGGGGKNYPFRSQDLAVAESNGAHLSHPANAGVFTTSANARPTATFNSANYYRDVVFIPEPLEPPSNAPVRINEFVAENQSGLLDEDGAASDWIELYNPQAITVDLTGYQLTDGTATWTFPATSLGPQSFLVVFASAKNRLNPLLHTNFKLEKSGEYLALKNSTGTILSEFAPLYPNQREDVAYGRGLPGGNLGFLPQPTPGTFNGTAYEGFVADTVFSVKRGFFTTPIAVSISTTTPGAQIRYTLDGSVPAETSALHTAPLQISTTTILRSRAFKAGFVPTNTDTQTYVFPADVLAQTTAGALASGWPVGPVNGQVLRYGTDSPAAALYTNGQKIAALTQISSMSIVTDQALLTSPGQGIYVNADLPDFEQAISLELLHSDGSTGFQIDCGARMRGGQSRGDAFPKKSFNFFFRKAYGPGKLDFPLFGADGAQKFDTFSLHCEHGYAYADPYGLDTRLFFSNLRDVFVRDLWASAGYQTTRSRPYHLYLNGQYWGLYETQERAQEDFGATYYGGAAAEYDGYVATGLPERESAVSAGSIAAWQALWSGARAVNDTPTNAHYFSLLGRNADGSPNPVFPLLLDPHELAAFMLLHYYTGHADAPLSISFNYERPNNFRALRRRVTNAPWHFFVHDAESSTRAQQWDEDRVNDNAALLTSPNRNELRYSNPEWIHEDLLANPEYRLTFADEAQRLLRHEGAFTATPALAMWNARAALIDQAVIGESIRWAQTSQENQATWNGVMDDVRTNFFPARSATVIAQLRTRGIFPTVDPPDFSQRGGQVSAGFPLSLNAAGGAPAGTIYYTTNGSDPRAVGGSSSGALFSNPIIINAPTTIRARFLSNSGEWSALDEVAFTTFTPASAGKLIVSKIHYHPPAPSSVEITAGFTNDNDFEYLEFQNISNETLDLRGVQVNAGVTFQFTNAALTLLAPGARVVIAENAGAFAMRYGAGLPLAGSYTGNLSNSGETVRVIDGAFATIALISYDDAAPWPTLPDGSGFALVLRDPAVSQALASNWRTSYSLGGKPGQLDIYTLEDWRHQYFTAEDLAEPGKEAAVWGNLADPDGDAFNNLLEYALGTLPADSEDAPGIAVALTEEVPGEPRYLQATYRLRQGTTGITLHAQSSGDLVNWQNLTPIETILLNNNATLITVRDPEPNPTATRRFFRLQVTAP